MESVKAVYPLKLLWDRPEVGGQVLSHLDALEAAIAKYLNHPVIRVEVPLVMRILKMMQLDISPQ